MSSTREPQAVLAVDDEPEILVALQDLLEPGFRVIACSDPVAALERVRTDASIAVILSDQRMPQMSGDQFLEKARAISDADAILLTGYADMEGVIAAINNGKVSGYVHKPWDNADLIAKVKLAADRHAARRALDLERRLFDGLLAGSGDAIALFDADGRVQRSNRDAAAVFDPGDRAAIATGQGGVEEVQSGDRLLRVQRVLLTQPDETRLLLRLESDLTRERALEARLRQAEKLEALGTLAGGIAHDFNNLLTAVIGNLELAVRRPDHPNVPRFVQSALQAANRGVSLTARLLSFSRQSAAGGRSTDVHALIEGMADLLTRTLGPGINVVADGCEPDLVVLADPDQLALAILNLCVNARDAMTGAGTITVGCTAVQIADGSRNDLPAGDYVAVAVTDTGSGMSPATVARAFDPFFTTKPVGKGTGLGLSMVYGFARASGGSVEIQTVEGRGTTISILLPLCGSREPAPAPDESMPAPAAAVRILLVEDDGAVRDVVRRHLEDLGHSVQAADSPEEALALLEGGRAPDVLVTDFAMPTLSGLDLVRRARDLRPDLPALLLTGFAEGAEVPGNVHRLAKPFSRDSLARALAQTLAGAHGQADEPR